uniref:TIL domain-containing protein n=1 Tax=Plectus sambesii TaxID=2011161 RepID=A0A914X2I5_9BILA
MARLLLPIFALVLVIIISASHAACPKKCSQNEECKECGSACEPNCEVSEPMICTMQCIVNVCQCKSGFVRNKSTGACVKKSDCPKKG